MSGEVVVRFYVLLSPLDRTQKPFVLRKSQSSHLKYHLDPAAWVLPGKMNAMKNLVHCNCGLATMSGEINVRFIMLLNSFDSTQGPVYLRKVRQVTGNITSTQQRGCFQVS